MLEIKSRHLTWVGPISAPLTQWVEIWPLFYTKNLHHCMEIIWAESFALLCLNRINCDTSDVKRGKPIDLFGQFLQQMFHR